MSYQQDGVATEVAQGRRAHSPRLHGHDNETNSTSFRAHPYNNNNRRPSLPRHDIDTSSRIHLPPPNLSGQTRSAEIPRHAPTSSQPINIPGIASLVHGSPPSSWRKIEQEPERYWHERGPKQEVPEQTRPRLDRSVSGDSVHCARPSLPPLHTLGVAESSSNTPTPTSTSMPPPSHRRANPTSPRYPFSRPASPPGSSSASRSIHHQQLQQQPQHQLQQHPGDRYPPQDRHLANIDYRSRDLSPPLRTVRNTYDVPGRHNTRAPEGYYPQMPGYGGVPNHRPHPHMPVDPYTGRPLGHPVHGGPIRHHDTVGPTGAVPGQSRRLAHLMSEQKRRESINTGFQALRKVVPSASPTDSKAVILRKAAAHIAQLETLLRTGDQTAARQSQALSLEQDELMGSASDSGAELEDDDDVGSDGDRREPVVKAERKSPRIWE